MARNKPDNPFLEPQFPRQKGLDPIIGHIPLCRLFDMNMVPIRCHLFELLLFGSRSGIDTYVHISILPLLYSVCFQKNIRKSNVPSRL